MIKKINYFSSLNKRPWPIIIRIQLFNLFFRALILFNNQRKIIFINLILLISLSILWWIDLRNEYNNIDESLNIKKSYELAIILFITSEIILFVSLFWSYLHFILSPLQELGQIWPPLIISPFKYNNTPIINTLILVFSSLTLTLSHIKVVNGILKSSIIYLIFTIILGSIFTILQAKEYVESYFAIRDSTFGSRFFILTGLHGIHVLAGSIILIVRLIRIINIKMSKNNSTNFELGTWYWHFVDVVWIYLFYLLYYLNN